MKNLLIIGARGYGREVFHLARASKGFGSEYAIKGFLDDKTNAMDNYPGYPPIVDSVEHYKIEKDDVFICALGDVNYKKKYAKMVLDRGGGFISLIHHTVKLGTNTKVGIGCIIMNDIMISCDIKIGDFVTIQTLCNLGHDVKIGNWCQINSFSFFGGYVVVEDDVTINPGAIIIPQKKIGKGATIGAGAVVIRNVKEFTTVFGNPATRI
jgi:sugar O-acyltransferase (sialic acid O-acetyltransferase NeuD family)